MKKKYISTDGNGFYRLIENMSQGTLFNRIEEKTIKIDNINAVFTKVKEHLYYVILEISSHKFLIKIQEGYNNSIQSFEIITAKGFIELGIKNTKMLKNLTQHLFLRLD